jgi:hypothetical protein
MRRLRLALVKKQLEEKATALVATHLHRHPTFLDGDWQRVWK